MFVSVHVVQFGQEAIEKAHKYALHLVVSRKVSPNVALETVPVCLTYDGPLGSNA